MWQFIRLLAGIACLLLAPLVGAVIAVCVIVAELRDYGFEKVGYHTVAEVLELIKQAVESLTSAWRKQPNV